MNNNGRSADHPLSDRLECRMRDVWAGTSDGPDTALIGRGSGIR